MNFFERVIVMNFEDSLYKVHFVFISCVCQLHHGPHGMRFVLFIHIKILHYFIIYYLLRIISNIAIDGHSNSRSSYRDGLLTRVHIDIDMFIH